MGLFGGKAPGDKTLLQRLTEPRESKRGVTMWDCPFCPALFWSEKKANAHISDCKGEVE